MKLISSILIWSAVLAAPCLAAPSAALVTPAAQEDTAALFRKQFSDALRISDAEQMAQIVKRYQIDAVDRIESVCTQISEGNSEELEREIQALIVAWRTSMKGEFASKYYQYLSLISPPERRERQRISYEFQTAARKYQENLEAKDGPTFEVLADQFKAFAGAFASIGDQYQSALAWRNYGYCFEEDIRSRKEKSPKKVIEGFSNAVAAMDRIDLKYAHYFTMKERAETLAGEGWQAVIDDPDAPEPGLPVAKGEAVSVPMTFEAIEKLTAFQRPSYFTDELYQMWPALFFGNSKSAEATVPSVTGGPRVLRREQASLEVHSDSDSTADGEIKITGKLALVETKINEGTERDWAFLAVTGIEADTYQGLQLNLAPGEYMSLYYVNAASMIGELAGIPVRVIDDNFDGWYGSYPLTWEYLGLSPGRSHPVTDSIIIGEKTKRALPWSQYQKVGEQWYFMSAEEGGTRLVATPMDLETGTLKLVFKGPSPSWVIVQGLEHLEWSYFDLLQNGKGKSVEVPAGSYMLSVGEVRKGKKAQTMKALMIAGDDTPVWDVMPGKETVVELGGPFGFDFKHSANDGTVTVVGQSVAIVGKAGERYERTWNCVPQPTASARAVGEKRGGKGEQMDIVLDMNEMVDGVAKYVYADVWHPLNLQLTARGEKFEVQLVEKKNKLFGKIESDWR